MHIFIILGIIVALLVTMFAYQNPVVVSVKFLGWHREGSLALICVSVFGLGFLTCFLFLLTNHIKHKWIIFRQKKKIADLEDELADREKRPVLDRHPS